MVSPIRSRWWCTICTREVHETTPGLAGPLGYCTHGGDDDGKPRATKLAPVVASEDEAVRLRDGRLDRQALHRALQKAHTEEGRKTLTSREARVLAESRGDFRGTEAT
jgi:hypothetical protein